MDEVIEIYERLKTMDASLNMRKFSCEYLGMSETYLFSRRYYGKPVSEKAKLKLYKQLRSTAQLWLGVYEEYGRAHYLARHRQYTDIALMAGSALLD